MFGEAGRCGPEEQAGGVRRRMLLARVPQAFHQAAEQCGVLAQEDLSQPDPRPAGEPDVAGRRLARPPNLGA